MSNQIVNAAPMVIEYGTQDLSTRQLPREPEAIPQHLPKFFLFTQKGPVEPQLVSGSEMGRIFGIESFNLRSKFANHATVYANQVNAQGNAIMVERVIPDDAGPEATLIAWLDVLPTTVDMYERNSDGSIKLNAIGDPTIIGNIPGFKVKWVVTNYTSVASAHNFGQLTIQPGDQVDTTTSTQSQRYPMFEMKASSRGYDGNMTGIRMWAPTTKSVSTMPNKMMNMYHAYPYFFSIIRRADIQKAPKLVETLFGEQKLMVTFKEDAFDPLTDRPLYIGNTVISAYENLTDLRYAKQFGDFSNMVIYKDNIDLLLTMFHAAEIANPLSFSDFTNDVEQKHLFNFVTGVASNNTPYNSFIFVDSPSTVRFSEYTNVYAGGGSDGTMNNQVFADLVTDRMEAYLDPNSPVQELAINVESVVYDSGFPMKTKLALCNIIALRKDTFVVLGTHDVDDRILTASEEHSVAIALRTRLQMTPESDYFGTPVMRGLIVGRCGKLRNSQYTGYLPLTLELAIKSARYMGAGNGRWKNGSGFDGAPGSVVDYMSDISITWVPASVRNRNWDVGLNWVQAYDRRSYFFPALKTVYDDDTSVLNSYFTALAIGQINKVVHSVWREFSGVDHLSNGQLIKAVNDLVTARVQNRFDERYVIVPDAQMTNMDILRGFSWTLPVKIYAPNMKTVMTSFVQAFRIDDLAAA